MMCRPIIKIKIKGIKLKKMVVANVWSKSNAENCIVPSSVHKCILSPKVTFEKKNSVSWEIGSYNRRAFRYVWQKWSNLLQQKKMKGAKGGLTMNGALTHAVFCIYDLEKKAEQPSRMHHCAVVRCNSLDSRGFEGQFWNYTEIALKPDGNLWQWRTLNCNFFFKVNNAI